MNLHQLGAFSLQFITQKNEKYNHLEAAALALKGGCKWIQLRMKEASLEEIEKVALQLQPLCKEAGAILIIDDHVELCKKIGADGVHLGKMDMLPADARKILGDGFLIGGTCNTFEEIQKIKDDVDYIGCGPFSFTTTKKNLAPVLGLEGYQNIIWECRSKGIQIPIVAIGGITSKDILPILKAGPNGIAISGTIANAEDPVKATENILKLIEKAF
ncbi:MAG TPA: thiamine phosphate synthase [Paludibacteraceae bacterium]|nr:thiamine phosphate synthase [Paludibacteraceae bacterium]HQF50809.1 thiamine phosphate synthase [Paludibacteraceae bacterium]HQJ89268.1 thiamine phosphate synthase [Paludibacteraceae bacterium]